MVLKGQWGLGSLKLNFSIIHRESASIAAELQLLGSVPVLGMTLAFMKR